MAGTTLTQKRFELYPVDPHIDDTNTRQVARIRALKILSLGKRGLVFEVLTARSHDEMRSGLTLNMPMKVFFLAPSKIDSYSLSYSCLYSTCIAW